jgi:alpha-mannosidase
MPSPFHPQRNFTDISDGKVGLMIASRGLRQAKAVHTGNGPEIALALLRCTGWLSLDDLSTRKGHAGSPFIATPAAQMQNSYGFEYSIIPHKGTWHNAFQQAYAFNAPMRAVIALPHAGIWGAAGSFIQSQPGTFVITAIKTAEDLNGLIVRGYNITAEQIDIIIRPLFTFTSVQKVSMGETRVADVPQAADGSVRLKGRAYEIITLRFIT